MDPRVRPRVQPAGTCLQGRPSNPLHTPLSSRDSFPGAIGVGAGRHLYRLPRFLPSSGLRPDLPAAAPEQQPADGAEQRSEERTSELQSLMRISYAVFCLKKKIKKK